MIVALLMTVLLGFCAFAVDVGRVKLEQIRLQNAADAAALAAVQSLPDTAAAKNAAEHYAALNGLRLDDSGVTFGNADTQVNVVTNRTVDYTFARIFGLTSQKVSAAASAARTSIGGPFRYAIFSGDPGALLQLGDVSISVINGSVHANGSIQFGGGDTTVTGSVEAGGTVSIYGNATTIDGQTVQNASQIAMPDFFNTVAAETQTDGTQTVYNSYRSFSGTTVTISTPTTIYGGASISGTVVNINAPLTVYGYTNLSASTLNINYPVVVYNNTLNLSCSSYGGSGALLSTGNIQLNGSFVAQNPSAPICIYSQNGNIQCSGSNVSITGVLYAPKGSIGLSASTMTINGRVIANRISYMTGSVVKVISSESDLVNLPKTGFRLVS